LLALPASTSLDLVLALEERELKLYEQNPSIGEGDNYILLIN